MSAAFTYQQLADRYANFIVPAAKIKVNGMDVLRTHRLVIHEMEISLALHMAGSVVVKFAHVYDEKSHSFGSGIRQVFPLGTIAEVELGYVSNTQQVFKGYVEMAGVEMGESELFVVTLMDVRRLMMASGKKSILHKVSNYSDAFTAVMESYRPLCRLSVDATSDGLEEPVPQAENDYEFVEYGLIQNGRADREFLVCGDTAYFRKPQKVKAPVMTLRYGRELLSLSVSHCYQDLKIRVLGVDDTEQEIRAEEKVTANMPLKKLIIPPPVHLVTDPYADTQSRADTRAQAEAGKVSIYGSIGHGTTLGLPEIVPGRFVQIENVDAFVNKKFYVTEVTHTYTDDTFVTQFEIGGC